MFADKVFIKSLDQYCLTSRCSGSRSNRHSPCLWLLRPTIKNAIALPSTVSSSSLSCYRNLAITFVWKWIYNPLSGIFELCIESGHHQQSFYFLLGDKHWTFLMAIIIILLTTSVGQPRSSIAAMNIDNSLVEAARVDGAIELLWFFWRRSKPIANNLVHWIHCDH